MIPSCAVEGRPLEVRVADRELGQEGLAEAADGHDDYVRSLGRFNSSACISDLHGPDAVREVRLRNGRVADDVGQLKLGDYVMHVWGTKISVRLSLTSIKTHTAEDILLGRPVASPILLGELPWTRRKLGSP